MSRDLGHPNQSISQVLHFLQREWSSFAQERAQWQYERGQLKQRISVLDGENTGLRKHNKDLLRRIRMLEMALQNERTKAGDGTVQKTLAEVATKKLPNRKPLKAKLAKVREGRLILQTYLKEVGITGNLVSVQAARFEEEYPSFENLLLSTDGHTLTEGNRTRYSVHDSFSSTDSPPTELNDEPPSYNQTTKNGDALLSIHSPTDSSSPFVMPPPATSTTTSSSIKGETAGSTGHVMKKLQILRSKKKLMTPADVADGTTSEGIEDNTDETEIVEIGKKIEGDTVIVSAHTNVREIALQPIQPGLDEDGDTDAAGPLEVDIHSLDDDDEEADLAGVDANDADEDDVIITEGDDVPTQLVAESLRQQQQQHRKGTASASDDAADEIDVLAEFDSVLEVAEESKDGDDAGDDDEEEDGNDDDDDIYKDIDDAELQASIAKRFGGKGMKMMKRAGKSSKSKKGNVRNLFGLDSSEGLGELADVSVENSKKHAAKAAIPFGEITATNDKLSELLGEDGSADVDEEDGARSGTLKVKRDWVLSYVLKGHMKGVTCVAVHDVFPLIITGSRDTTVKAWWLPERKSKPNYSVIPSITFRGHTGEVTAVVLLSTADKCISAAHDGSIRCWAIPTEEIGPYDNQYEAPEEFVIHAHGAAIASISLNDDKDSLASCANDGTCSVWDLATQKRIATRKLDNDEIPTAVHVFEHNHGRIAICTNTGSIHIADAATLAITRTIVASSESPVACLAVTSQTALPIFAVSLSDNTVRIFDSESGGEMRSLSAHPCPTTSLAFSEDAALMTTGSDRKIRVWNTDSLSCIWDKTAHRMGPNGGVLSGAFRKDASLLATAGAEGTVRIYLL